MDAREGLYISCRYHHTNMLIKVKNKIASQVFHKTIYNVENRLWGCSGSLGCWYTCPTCKPSTLSKIVRICRHRIWPWRWYLGVRLLNFIAHKTKANNFSANLARAGHSVFLIEAGDDHGDSLLQRVPAM